MIQVITMYQVEGSVGQVTLVGAVKLLLTSKVPGTQGVRHGPSVLTPPVIPTEYRFKLLYRNQSYTFSHI